MIRLHKVNKRYQVGGDVVVGLHDVSLELHRGDFACLRGPSGSGKTTLLLTVGGMQRPTSGTVDIANAQDVYALGQAARTRIRAQRIGFVFQMFHLIPYLNVLDNILLGAGARGASRREADALLERVGLSHRRRHRPSQLSVGECQRVAVARALLSHPEVILADEPTGNLDEANARIVIDVMQEFCQGGGVLLLATHSRQPLDHANRTLEIEAGRLFHGRTAVDCQ